MISLRALALGLLLKLNSSLNYMEDISRRFNDAICSKDVGRARSIATMFDTSPVSQGLRLAAYKEVLMLALQLGNGMAAQEVAPFAGERITILQYKECMDAAVERGDLTNVIWCSHCCGKRPTKSQLESLRFGNEYVQLIDIIRRHLRDSDLTNEELLSLWCAEVKEEE